MLYCKTQLQLDFNIFFKAAVVILFLLLPLSTEASLSVGKLWTRTNIYKINNKFVYLFHPNIRFFQKDMKLQQFLPEASIGYLLTNQLIPSLGVSWLNSDDDVGPNIQEFRLWQQLRYSKNQNLSFRTRLEQRKFAGENKLALRFRQKARYVLPLSTNLSLDLHNELLINLIRPPVIISKTLDQNRAYIGIWAKLTPSVNIGTGYMNQYLFRSPSIIGQIALINIDWSLDN